LFGLNQQDPSFDDANCTRIIIVGITAPINGIKEGDFKYIWNYFKN
jgi:hypothetical protein